MYLFFLCGGLEGGSVVGLFVIVGVAAVGDVVNEGIGRNCGNEKDL